jgi:hypothetical protein
MSNGSGWPTVPEGLSAAKKEAREKAIFDAKIKRAESNKTAEDAINAEFYKAVFAVAQGSIDRTRASAATVQTASAAIAALYTSLLGVVFSVTNNPLPSRGVIPVLFLGLAILASTGYLAYLTHAAPIRLLEAKPSRFEREAERARSLIIWTRRASEHKAYLLRLSVVALGFGLAFLPAPFLSFSGKPSGGSATSATTATATPAWPTPSPEAGTDPALKKVVYTAQVAEVAAQRKASKATPSNSGGNDRWWWAALVAALVALFLPSVINKLIGGVQAEDIPAG